MVKAQDWADEWNRVTDQRFAHLVHPRPRQGLRRRRLLTDKTAKLSGVKVIDDYTLEVTLVSFAGSR